MIAKAVPKDPKIPDNFKALAEYIAAAKEEGEKLDQFWTRNCDAGSDLKDLDVILDEVESVRQVRKDIANKTYHLAVSFRPGERERLTIDDLKDIEESFAKALGFAEHQRVVGTHINTDNFHMHVAYNKVHPQTLKVITPYSDYKALERTARRLERKYGLYVDRGMSDYAFGTPKLSQQARHFEAQTWQQSFQNYVLEHRDGLLEAIGKAEDWPALHAVLADYDVVIRKRGNGLALVSPDGAQAMKASLLDRSCSKGELERRLGGFRFAPDPEKTAGKEDGRKSGAKHRYTARPKVLHPNLNRLWHRYLMTRRSPLQKRPSLLKRTIRHWKMYLLAEAYRDPLAMALLFAHQELLHMVLGGGPSSSGPLPMLKAASPALAAWRETKEWAKASALDWVSDRPNAGYGCRLDEAGNLVVPFRDLDGHIQGLRLLSKEGRSLDIGDLSGAGIVHVIDPGKALGQGHAVFVTDYANAVAIQDASRVPVIVVSDPKALKKTIREMRKAHPGIKPVLAVADAEDRQRQAARLRDLAEVLVMPKERDARTLRSAFARGLDDRASMVWDAAGDWATPGNSEWLKEAGIRGYGVKLTADGGLVIPLKDGKGRLEDVMLVSQAGEVHRVIGDEAGPPLMHVIDPERRLGKDTIIVATDYASAAAIHRATRLPVVMAASPDQWAEVTEVMRRRFKDETIVVALPAGEQSGDAERARVFRADLVRPERAASFGEYAVNDRVPRGAELIDMGAAPYEFDDKAKESWFVKLRDPDRTERHLWGVDLESTINKAGVEKGDHVRLRISGKKAVTITETIKSKDGKPVTRTREVMRNDWEVTKLLAPEERADLDALRTEFAAATDDRTWIRWKAAEPVVERDEVLERIFGGVEAFPDVRKEDAEGNYLLALRDAGNRLWGVQVLDCEGQLAEALGASSDKGLFHVVGGRLKEGNEPLVIADDLAKAVAAHEATGQPVVWSVSADNLKLTEEALKRRYGDRELAISATDRSLATVNGNIHEKQETVEAVVP